jgi:glutathione S-transferase
MLVGSLLLARKAKRRKVRTAMIWGSALIANEVGPMIFAAFLPSALAEGRFAAAPAPTLVGRGLAQIPAALERQRQGVSATKLVVTL